MIGFSQVQFPRHPNLFPENELHHTDEIENRLAAQFVRFDSVTVWLPHLKRHPLKIGYKLLDRRFVNGVQGQGTESRQDVLRENALHAKNGTWLSIRPSLVILAAPLNALPKRDNGTDIHRSFKVFCCIHPE